MTKKIGIFGFGSEAQNYIQMLNTSGIDAEVMKICVKNLSIVADIDSPLLTFDPKSITENPEIDIVIELIDNADFAYEVVKSSLENGKFVISTNYEMIAEHLLELISWNQIFENKLFYESAVSGSAPLIQSVQRFSGEQKITRVRGILNGSTNYILSHMREKRLTLKDFLNEQKTGLTKLDAELNLSEIDTAHKLIILAYHTYGKTISNLEEIRIESISNMEDHFFELAEAQNLKIKSVATAYLKNDVLCLKIQPELVSSDDLLYDIENEHLAIVIEDEHGRSQCLTQKDSENTSIGVVAFNEFSSLIKELSQQNPRNTSLQKSA